MPSSMAACIMRTASSSSLSTPICQPPKATIETRWLVRPSTRVGIPVADALEVCAIIWSAKAATEAATVASLTKSRRELGFCIGSKLLSDLSYSKLEPQVPSIGRILLTWGQREGAAWEWYQGAVASTGADFALSFAFLSNADTAYRYFF